MASTVYCRTPQPKVRNSAQMKAASLKSLSGVVSIRPLTFSSTTAKGNLFLTYPKISWKDLPVLAEPVWTQFLFAERLGFALLRALQMKPWHKD